MFFGYHGLGNTAPTQEAYICLTGACVPYALAQACTGNSARWPELIPLNPTKLNKSGPISAAAYQGWLVLPGDWQCPSKIATRTIASAPVTAPIDTAPVPVTTPPTPSTPIVSIEAPINIGVPGGPSSAEESTPIEPSPADPVSPPPDAYAPPPPVLFEEKKPSVHPGIIIGGVAAVALIGVLIFTQKKR